MRKQSLWWTAIAAAVLSLSASGWAQFPTIPSRPGEIRGQIRFPNGKTAPFGVPVTLIHREGDMVAQLQTDSSGKFSFSPVNPGIYRVKVHLHGYLDAESQEMDLNLMPMHYVNLELKPDPNYKDPFISAAPGGVISAESLGAPEAAVKDLEAGKTLLEKGEYPNSIELFKKAIKKFPNYSEAYLMMGVAYRAQNDLEQAGAALQKCIGINGTSLAAYIALGEVQNERKDYAGAEQTLLKAVQLNPEQAVVHVELARSLWALGRWQDADPHVTKALALAPDNASAHLIMGNIQLRKRDGRAALLQFQEYLKLDPQGPMAPSVRDLVGKLEKALGPETAK